jgi:hypothetical protein
VINDTAIWPLVGNVAGGTGNDRQRQIVGVRRLIRTAMNLRSSSGRCAHSRHLAEDYPRGALVIAHLTSRISERLGVATWMSASMPLVAPVTRKVDVVAISLP